MLITIDGAGRVVIPKRLREALGVADGGDVEIELEGDEVRLRAVGFATVERNSRGFPVVRPADGGGVQGISAADLRDILEAARRGE